VAALAVSDERVVEDQTHQATWQPLAELLQRPDFDYVVDCKLATTDKLNKIARRGGRFIAVLPASRKGGQAVSPATT
jgi:hypothetical protein